MNNIQPFLSSMTLLRSYQLVSYQESYRDYLKAMGIPGFVLPMILSADERVTITGSSDPESTWSITTDMGKALQD